MPGCLHAIQTAPQEVKIKRTKGAKISRANFKLSNASLAASKLVDLANTFLLELANSPTEETNPDSRKLEVLLRNEATAQPVQTQSNLKVLK